MIESTEDLGVILRHANLGDIRNPKFWEKYGRVSIRTMDSLILFNYTAECQFKSPSQWNTFEKMSRGLIMDMYSGECVARPFDKFWNWGESGMKTDAPIVHVTEKLDGSLGILYRHDGFYQVATRGSFDSDQAAWATNWLQENIDLDDFPDEWTLLFEIIYPENRIVIDYGDRAELVLIAVRDRFTGEYLPYGPRHVFSVSSVKDVASEFGFSCAILSGSELKEIDLLKKAAQSIPGSQEGWVVEFADGSRFKFKGEEYLKLHKLINGLSYKHTVEALSSNGWDGGKFLKNVPEEFCPLVEGWTLDILNRRQDIITSIAVGYIEAESRFMDVSVLRGEKAGRKEFAAFVMRNYADLSSLFFARLDGRPIDDLIYKLILAEDKEGV